MQGDARRHGRFWVDKLHTAIEFERDETQDVGGLDEAPVAFSRGVAAGPERHLGVLEPEPRLRKRPVMSDVVVVQMREDHLTLCLTVHTECGQHLKRIAHDRSTWTLRRG